MSSGGFEVVSNGVASGTILRPGGVIDFPNLTFSGGSAVLNNTNDVLTVTEGAVIATLTLSGIYTGETVVPSLDKTTGTEITLTILPPPADRAMVWTVPRA